ncbi:hypothetical protein Leryth_025339, partial [Lithospermum erythrorhizon]
MQSRLLSYSQTMPPGNPQSGVASTTPTSNQKNLPPKNHKNNKLKDKRYDSFKTWSGKLERQLTMRGKRRPKDEVDSYPKPDMEILLVHRYFDALKGPELDTLRRSEEILLPKDNCNAFLLNSVSSFGIC